MSPAPIKRTSSILNHQSSILNPKSKIQNPKSKILNPTSIFQEGISRKAAKGQGAKEDDHELRETSFASLRLCARHLLFRFSSVFCLLLFQLSGYSSLPLPLRSLVPFCGHMHFCLKEAQKSAKEDDHELRPPPLMGCSHSATGAGQIEIIGSTSIAEPVSACNTHGWPKVQMVRKDGHRPDSLNGLSGPRQGHRRPTR